MSTNKPAACPFCGNETSEVDEIDMAIFAVYCGECGTVGPHVEDFRDEARGRLRAQEKWNTRPTTPRESRQQPERIAL